MEVRCLSHEDSLFKFELKKLENYLDKKDN